MFLFRYFVGSVLTVLFNFVEVGTGLGIVCVWFSCSLKIEEVFRVCVCVCEFGVIEMTCCNNVNVGNNNEGNDNFTS